MRRQAILLLAFFAICHLLFAIAPQPRHFQLTWSHVPNGPVIFQVYRTTNLGLGPFTWWTNVGAPPVPLAADLPREFFFVRASNYNNGLVSLP